MVAHFLLALLAASLVLDVAATPARAAPKRIIIQRHGEEQSATKLCELGVLRSLALTSRYLGRNADDSLFTRNERPIFLAITLRTLELVTPAAASWNQPVTTYAIVPMWEQANGADLQALNQRTRAAVQEVMASQIWSGRTVVMTWERRHIASPTLEAQFPREKVTLRQLLNLDRLAGVPDTWPEDTYNYFWLIDYARGSTAPSQFRQLKQTFGPPYEAVPSNNWAEPLQLPAGSRCRQ